MKKDSYLGKLWWKGKHEANVKIEPLIVTCSNFLDGSPTILNIDGMTISGCVKMLREHTFPMLDEPEEEHSIYVPLDLPPVRVATVKTISCDNAPREFISTQDIRDCKVSRLN